MPDGNGQSEWQAETQRPLEALEKAHRDLNQSLIVITEVEARMAQIALRQAEWLANHEQRVAEHEAIWRRIDTGLAEATDKIKFIIDREMRREGGPASA
jgi:hypothetical protein